MSKYNQIIPLARAGQVYQEGALTAAAKPGILVTVGVRTAGDATEFLLTPNAKRGQSCAIIKETVGGTHYGSAVRNVSLANGEAASVALLEKGMFVTVYVKAGVAIVKDDYLVPDVDGLADKASIVPASEGVEAVDETISCPQLFRAVEVCGADAADDNRRILVAVVR